MFKKIISLLCIYALMFASPHVRAAESTGALTSATFTAQAIDAAAIINPERGWAHHLQSGSGDILGSIDTALFSTALSNNTRLVMCNFNLSAVRTTDDITSTVTTIRTRLQTVKDNGFKCVVWFFYNFASGGADATVARTVSHIGQLRNTFRDYADTIAYVKAGFIGAWGEGHSSTNCNAYYGTITVGCTLAVANANYTSIRDALLSAVHPYTHVQFRQPHMIQANWYTSALTASQSYSGTARSRVAIHNDCLLSGSGAYNGTGTQDTGTWQYGTPAITESSMRAYAAQATTYTPYGGELSTSCATPLRVLCNEAYGVLADYASFNLTWMKGPNAQTATYTSSWSSGGCLSTVYNKMGYRLQYDSVSHQSTATAGQTVTATINLRNVGWSRIHSPRKVQMVMVRQGGGASDIVCNSRVDLRALPSQASASSVVAINCTTGIAGTWNVHLRMPDHWATTAGTAAFAIRPANTDSGGQSWDATNFRWTTGTTIVVS